MRRTLTSYFLYILLPLSLFFCYIRILCPDIVWGEGPLLGVCARYLGISHPPGYPLALLLINVIQRLPFGSIAYRGNLFSALCGASAALCIYAMARRFNQPRWSAALCTLCIGLTPTIVYAATMAEVYALNLFFVSFCLLCATCKRIGVFYLLCFIFGLSLGNHLTILLLVPGLLIILAPTIKLIIKEGYQSLLLSVLFLLLGASILLYNPIRARSASPIRWDKPDSWNRFFTLVSAMDEALPSFGSTPPGTFLTNIRQKLVPLLLTDRYPLILILIGLLGVVHGLYSRPRYFGAFITILISYTIPISLYWTNETDYFAIPMNICIGLFISQGIIALYLSFRKLHRYQLGYVVVTILIASILLYTVGVFPGLDRSADWLPYYYCRALLQGVGERGIIITERSDLSFMLWYLRFIEKNDMNTAVFFKHLFSFAWAMEAWQKVYPFARYPTTHTGDFEDSYKWNTTYTAAMIKLNYESLPVYVTELQYVISDIMPVMPGKLIPQGILFRYVRVDDTLQPVCPSYLNLPSQGAEALSLAAVQTHLSNLEYALHKWTPDIKDDCWRKVISALK